MFALCSEKAFAAGTGYAGGSKTSETNDDDWEDFWNYKCVKTYAAGTEKMHDFSYYFKSKTSYDSIPGLTSTNVEGDNCEWMTPQGICEMGDYTIISAYCSEKGDKQHKSVLYVIEDGNLVATLVLPYTKNYRHVGGLTYDGKYLWIANGLTDYESKDDVVNGKLKRMHYIRGTAIENAVKLCQQKKYKSYSLDSTYNTCFVKIDCDPAYCTYFEGKLFCGEFSSTKKVNMFTYSIDKSGTAPKLKKIGYWEVPRATQSVTFYRFNGVLYLITSNSWRRTYTKANYEHRLIVYKPTDFDTLNSQGGTDRDYHKGNRICDITIPNMSEQISTVSTQSATLLLIFESYAQQYRDDVDECSRCSSYFELDFYKVCVD